ncbi:NitT/TauT family transport system ATP-binding protein [Geodermatophilus telluris]|uniref:NitT/TauT family transport system ATP-binding protein n=1 Tax=Geodermatophilus telluris TaxID=1190417 RepID=A0A1G6UGL8_9ACTN|nr:ABC transporter ATP-binding protein [Geodermatophilus telluris]SDD40550.1 NitT/TauT family transport system ATP-binding protein [Geodermatophilus telluris]
MSTVTASTSSGAGGLRSVGAEAGPSVRVQGVCQSFDRMGPPVLDGVDLTVAPGEFLCLLGASGCGKSTLLNLLAGLAEPTAGTVDVAADRPSLMFQEPALLPWLTAGGNVELALKPRGMRRAQRREESARLLRLVNLEGQSGKRPHELSGGMRQRVALARALAQDSPVLLMDEPFAALDAITRDVLHEELVRVWSTQRLTVVFVTHNVREAVRLAQRVVLMSSRPGRIVREWAVELSQPRAIESPGVGALATEITTELHREISRHAR